VQSIAIDAAHVARHRERPKSRMAPACQHRAAGVRRGAMGRTSSIPPDMDERIAVSPRHSVRLAQELVPFVHVAPRHDFVVRTIGRREANGMPLMSAEIVIAGADTRERYPRAAQYPLHFRKTYYPGRLHGDPHDEFDRQADAAELIGIPPPIGWSHDTFRSCLPPGVPYNRLSPFEVEPEDAKIHVARELQLIAAIGLFTLCEQAYRRMSELHAGGIAHRDAELHNLIVCASPLEIVMIDFEGSATRKALAEAEWDEAIDSDFAALAKEGALLQCSLGRQRGGFAELCLRRVPTLFRDGERVLAEIDRRTVQSA
jgi:hypothetical protein